ncbi:bifunctional D-glycero-beta-D-manno-heptose-7-phosphate kinase/D-glycero-beta-D-manno-heptose 1-phosphate adenylyltransferase HldE [Pseudohongiella sp.]|uniref:D-glycero-beta-D-manno-heptose 1-phosphate adenylyltransferase n=1 Tax=marine sediment metagenome TaxID=412755 RepID=A0A0F9YW29_9ZZZZ|nr:bifunctional D-glycero-beta-D-manno-heptose-7-phosphate kinase/D-glycero-beta-D-manno-heptose 1-phosphate adenylyltransferase HldE [Pseudohongiella sp.]HDZ07927.1 bifunctional D-glycero-beta-D-manno-heptose-7-phosphate kinase/D-glycero-beta-D-manno-heptose 1-phosphate adenylyltransferase HldE [Pseudohongiella sp.]HEA64466.1 bifunctional D-glycero-beta-D-manno-heptose-7-phosphate kinase/D-glycero-beta-D-manno-heptose 1-phosphate adenylyltransferase HldE [Pseudohongiella sp.]
MKLEMPPFQQATVLVVGDVMLDRYWHGKASRISPEAPVPVVKVNGNDDRPGGAANVALNIAALGAAATLAGITGQDEAGEELARRLTAAGVLCHFQTSASAPTITKLRVTSQHQQLLRVDFEEPFADDDVASLQQQAIEAMSASRVLILSDYGKGTLGQTQALIQAARERDIPIVVDPKGHDFSKYRGATVITPNLSEFEAVVGPCRTEEDVVNKGQALREELALDALLITRGEQGMTLLQAGRPVLHLPAQAREVFDVTGAGDTVVSVLAAALAAGQSLETGMALANLAAGLVVAKLGTAAISGPELRRAIQLQEGTGRGVMTAEQLATVVEDARAQGEKIVFTNGCFDIIHAGHVGYLEDARKQGDRLIVAINDDDSVRRLKGSGRPINPVERRMAVLAGLSAVDWVVSFPEDTPESLLQLLRPDVLVKGGDYSVDTVVGGEFVRSYGGEVRVLAFLDNCSTSAIVEKMKQS